MITDTVEIKIKGIFLRKYFNTRYFHRGITFLKGVYCLLSNVRCYT